MDVIEKGWNMIVSEVLNKRERQNDTIHISIRDFLSLVIS